jgi:hypothetical protein
MNPLSHIPLPQCINQISKMMKKSIITVYLMILSLGVSSAFAAETGKKNKSDEATNAKSEYKMTEEDYDRITRRVEEIRAMDKSELNAAEKTTLKKELKEMKAMVKEQGGYVYLGAGTLLVVILLIILLL